MLMVALISVGASFAVAFPLSILLGLTGQHFIALAINPTKDVFGPVTFVAFYFTLCIGIRALYIVVLAPDAHRLGRIGYDDFLPQALWCAALAYISFLIGFHLPLGNRLQSGAPRRELRWPKSVPVVGIALLSSLGFLAMVYGFRHGLGVVGNSRSEASEGVTGPLQLLFQLISVGWVASCIFLFSRDRIRDKNAALPLVLLSLLCIAARIGITGGKQALVEPLLEVLMVFHYLNKRLRFWQLAAVGLPAVLLAFGAINFYRFVIVRQGGAPRSFGDIVSLASTAYDRFTSGSTAGQASALDQMMNRQAGVDALALVMKYTPNPQPFGHGDSFARALLSVSVPRALWPAKPIYSPSRDFEQNYMGMPGFFNGASSPQLVADLYQNFGLIGVTAGMLLLGAFFRWLYLFCILGVRSSSGVFLYASLLPSLVHLMEAVVGNMLIQFPRAVLVVICAGAFIGVRYSKVRWGSRRAFASVATPKGSPVFQG
jgi:hypothetical protein